MDNYPKISIVTPNYNGGGFLEDTILSVLDQNYPNLEYIIIDGGSTDNSIEIIKKYEQNLTYWESKPDRGIYDAVQKGMEKTSGKLRSWNNSDEMYNGKGLFTGAENFSSYEQVNWLTGALTGYDENNRTVEVLRARQWSKYDYYLGDHKTIQQESTFWRRKLWDAAGARLNTHLKLAGDFELWLRFFGYEKLYTVNALVGGFRMRHANQASLEGSGQYYDELMELLRRIELKDDEKSTLDTIKKYATVKNRLERISLFKFLSYNYFREIIENKVNKLKQYPPRIVFDRSAQRFVLKENKKNDKS